MPMEHLVSLTHDPGAVNGKRTQHVPLTQHRLHGYIDTHLAPGTQTYQLLFYGSLEAMAQSRDRYLQPVRPVEQPLSCPSGILVPAAAAHDHGRRHLSCSRQPRGQRGRQEACCSRSEGQYGHQYRVHGVLCRFLRHTLGARRCWLRAPAAGRRGDANNKSGFRRKREAFLV